MRGTGFHTAVAHDLGLPEEVVEKYVKEMDGFMPLAGAMFISKYLPDESRSEIIARAKFYCVGKNGQPLDYANGFCSVTDDKEYPTPRLLQKKLKERDFISKYEGLGIQLTVTCGTLGSNVKIFHEALAAREIWGVVVDISYFNGKDLIGAKRLVYPEKIETKPFNFNVSIEHVRFVRLHLHAAEYVTASGVSVYDNRKGEGKYSLFRTSVYDFLDSLEAHCLSPKERIGWILLRHIIREEKSGSFYDDLIHTALPLYIGNPYFPLQTIVRNKWNMQVKVKYEEKDLIGRIKRGTSEDPFNPVYVVIE